MRPPRSGEYSACKRKSNSANSSWRIICSPAWKLRVDFGPEIGVKRSSAQITNYAREELEGRLVVGVVNFPPRPIGPVRSEVLVLGTYSDDGVLLLTPAPNAALGDRVG